jgi:pimeloyl-ACP methyl ester carboxylesterase
MSSSSALELKLQLNRDATLYYIISPEIHETPTDEKRIINEVEVKSLVNARNLPFNNQYGTIELTKDVTSTLNFNDLGDEFYIYLAIESTFINDVAPFYSYYQYKNEALRTIHGLTGDNSYYEYILSLPSEYSSTSDNQLPILLQLHGAGSKGDPIELDNGWVHNFIRYKNKKAVVVNPHTNDGWNYTKLNNLISHLLNIYNVDEKRIYVTGYSMGGRGAFDYGVAHGNRIAALVPMAGACSFSDSDLPGELIDLPIWAFHNDGDPVVNVYQSQRIFDILDNYTSIPTPKLTIYENRNTHSLNSGYGIYNIETLNWIFNQTR